MNKINLNKKSDIFFEVRELRDFANNDNHYSYLGGLEFKFGRKTSQISNETSKITHKIVYIDSDFDGVPDNLDKSGMTFVDVYVMTICHNFLNYY